MVNRRILEKDKVIIFDWDDTILPSTFVDQCQVEHINEMPAYVRRWKSPDQSLGYSLVGGDSFCISHARKIIDTDLTRLFFNSLQYQKVLSDISKCAARCLHEASKYGEVCLI
jgi:hypothetical protein